MPHVRAVRLIEFLFLASNNYKNIVIVPHSIPKLTLMVKYTQKYVEMMGIHVNTLSYVLSERKHLGKKSDAC